MKRKEYGRIYCHKEFKKKLQIESIEKGFKNLVEYTKHLAEHNENKIEEIHDKKKKRWKFNI